MDFSTACLPACLPACLHSAKHSGQLATAKALIFYRKVAIQWRKIFCLFIYLLMLYSTSAEGL